MLRILTMALMASGVASFRQRDVDMGSETIALSEKSSESQNTSGGYVSWCATVSDTDCSAGELIEDIGPETATSDWKKIYPKFVDHCTVQFKGGMINFRTSLNLPITYLNHMEIGRKTVYNQHGMMSFMRNKTKVDDARFVKLHFDVKQLGSSRSGTKGEYAIVGWHQPLQSVSKPGLTYSPYELAQKFYDNVLEQSTMCKDELRILGQRALGGCKAQQQANGGTKEKSDQADDALKKFRAASRDPSGDAIGGFKEEIQKLADRCQAECDKK